MSDVDQNDLLEVSLENFNPNVDGYTKRGTSFLQRKCTTKKLFVTFVRITSSKSILNVNFFFYRNG